MMRDPIDRLGSGEARATLKRIREILWPRRNPNEQWSPDTLDAIGEVIAPLRQKRRRRTRRASTLDFS